MFKSKYKNNSSVVRLNQLMSKDQVYFTTRVTDTSNTSATRVRRKQCKCNMSEKRATPMQHEWHECDASATRTTRALHECGTSATRVKNFDFGNNTSENIF